MSNPVDDELDKIFEQYENDKFSFTHGTALVGDIEPRQKLKQALLAWHSQGVGEAYKAGMMAAWTPIYNWLYNNHKELLPEWEALMEETMKTCQCNQCLSSPTPHYSDCGVHNSPVEPCNCRTTTRHHEQCKDQAVDDYVDTCSHLCPRNPDERIKHHE